MARPLVALLAATTVLAGPGVPVVLGQAAVDFQRDIRPLLSGRCFKCHGPSAHKGKLRLDQRDWATKRQAIVPGKPEASELVRRVLAGDKERMPPTEAGDRLKPEQVALLKEWIKQGAEFAPHWALVQPKRPLLPVVKDEAWPRNPIDHFILADLEKKGFRPSEEADRPTLVRRLSLDLLGLLPSPKEVADFVQDACPDAHERLVDRLLASPHYGERQARHWLDLARYADSNGYTIDGKRSIWPWRDWVIAAFNRNMPFDQFTLEQLAGDLLPGATKEQLIATGFHRNTSFNEEGGTNPEQFRVERTVDRTNTTGTTWLGLTIGCAQCHDHKYDPISQKEYYQIYAFFNSTEEPKLSLPNPEQAKKLHELQAALAQAKKEPAPRPKSPQELEKLVAALEKETNGGWRIIYPKAVMSEQGATFAALEDRSVLAGGKVGPSDTYVVQAVAPETGILTAVRLEALTHPSLPHKGPGRASNGNFVLSQIAFETDGVPHPFRKAVADYSQAGYDVSDAIRGDPNKGWAVNAGDPKQFNVDRQAIFYLKKPHEVREGQAFVFTLRFSQVPSSYSLGRFRLAITFASPRFLELPLAAQQIVLTDRRQRGPADMDRLQKALAHNNVLSERVALLRKEIQALESQVDSTLILRATARPRPTHLLKRGDFLAPGEAVEPGTLAVLPSLGATGRLAGRIDLARWLVAPENPLTARVVVNRMWQQYFGKGLVETENDFGTQGSLPTHPELLDWLATEIHRHGWGLKTMHRLIVTSATYRQASRARPDLREKDPGNRLLGRQHRLRLEAETIRDAALSVSGLLARKIGGPGVYPPQPPEIFSFTQNNHPWPESKGPDRYRRGMYTFIWRQSQHPLLTTFDAPDAQTACTRRNRSDTPLQALHLANDPTFMEIAHALAGRITREGPADDAGRVDYAFRLCFSRCPGSAERSRLLAYLVQQRQAEPTQAWTMVARVLLNLDEFITRE
jgi:hypothetical protein